jgi:hypothetical protein
MAPGPTRLSRKLFEDAEHRQRFPRGSRSTAWSSQATTSRARVRSAASESRWSLAECTTDPALASGPGTPSVARIGDGRVPSALGDCRRAIACSILLGWDSWRRVRNEMHAEFDLTPGQKLFDRLPALFGARDLNAVTQSRVLRHLQDKTNPRYWAAEERPQYRLSAWWATAGTMRLIIEPTAPLDVRLACQEVWDEVRNSASDLTPRVRSLTLQDDVATQPLAKAQTGRLRGAAQAERIWTFAAAIASVIWLVAAAFIFRPSGDLVLGAIPAIAVGLVAGVYAFVDSRSSTIYWS